MSGLTGKTIQDLMEKASNLDSMKQKYERQQKVLNRYENRKKVFEAPKFADKIDTSMIKTKDVEGK